MADHRNWIRGLGLVRMGNEGKAVLLVGPADPVILPYSFALGADGLPVKRVRLEFGVQGNAVVVVHGEQTFRMAAEVAPSLEVAISGGAAQAWAFDRLIVQTPEIPEVVATKPLDKAASPSVEADAQLPNTLASFTDGASRRHNNRAAPKPSVKAEANPDAPIVPPNALLGVFTPPSVRQRIAERLSSVSPKIER